MNTDVDKQSNDENNVDAKTIENQSEAKNDKSGTSKNIENRPTEIEPNNDQTNINNNKNDQNETVLYHIL